MARFLEHYQRGRPRLASDALERALLEVLEPAAQRASTDLFVLTHGRPSLAGSKREFYEVTLVQTLYQYLLMAPSLHDYTIRWEAPYGNGATNPKRVDLVLERPTDGSGPTLMLLEAGRFAVSKLKEDSEKLRGLQKNGSPVNGLKRVLLYWIGSDAPATAAAVREAIQRPMRNAASSKRVGPHHIKPLWVQGCELFGGPTHTQFSAVMVEVLP